MNSGHEQFIRKLQTSSMQPSAAPIPEHQLSRPQHRSAAPGRLPDQQPTCQSDQHSQAPGEQMYWFTDLMCQTFGICRAMPGMRVYRSRQQKNPAASPAQPPHGQPTTLTHSEACHSGEIRKVPEELQSHMLALLGMELGGKQAAAGNHRCKSLAAMNRSCRDHRFIRWHNMITVHKID